MNLIEDARIANDKSLSKREFDVLKYFVDHEGKLVTEKELINNFWTNPHSRVVATTISRLRRKLGRDIIETRYGLGYIYNEKCN